jgi:hypothetical protein
MGVISSVPSCPGATTLGALTTSGAVALNGSNTIGGSIIATYGGAGISYTPGTGVTSVACVSGYSCNNIRGQILITNSSATTSQVLATVHFGSSPLSSVPECLITQQTGTAWYGLFANVTNSQFTATNNNTVSGVTSLFVSYSRRSAPCGPR